MRCGNFRSTLKQSACPRKHNVGINIRQEDLVWSGNKQELVDDGTKSVNDIVSGFKKFSDDRVGSVILVPDTNALLWQPDFTDYNLHDRKIELILIPAVLMD